MNKKNFLIPALLVLLSFFLPAISHAASCSTPANGVASNGSVVTFSNQTYYGPDAGSFAQGTYSPTQCFTYCNNYSTANNQSLVCTFSAKPVSGGPGNQGGEQALCTANIGGTYTYGNYGPGTSVISVCQYTPPATASLSASPSSIALGNASALSWSSTNANSCTGSGFSTNGATSGTVSVSPSSTTNYSVSCSGSVNTASASAQVSVTQPTPLSAYCSVSPTSALTGQSVTWSGGASGGTAPYNYSWSGTNLSGSGTSVSTSYGSAGTYYATLGVSDSGVNAGYQSTSANCSNSVYITNPVPTASLYASPSSIIDGNSTTLVWSSTNGSSASIDNGVGGISPVSGGQVTVSPTQTTTYTLTVNGPGGTATAQTTVTVNTPDLTSTTGGNLTDTTGQPVTLSGTASNIGTGAASYFPNIIQVCDANCATVNSVFSASSISSLAVGSSATFSGSYTPSAANTLYYRTCANETPTSGSNFTPYLTESNYGNNCGNWSTLTVNPPIPPTPTNPVTTCDPSGTSVSFSWSAAPGATVYYYPRIYAPTAAQCNAYGWQVWTGDNQTCYPNPDDYTGTSVNNFPITPGQTYSWWTESGNSGGSTNQTIGNSSFSCAAPADLTSATGPTVTDVVNQPVTLSGTASNIGTGAASYFPNIIQVCDANCATVNSVFSASSISSLAVGSSATFSGSYTPSAANTLYYRTCANETPTSGSNFTPYLTESNYGNNCGNWSTLSVASPLTASCSASPSGTIPAPANVTWSANPSGGNGAYTYSWGGNVSGTSQSESQSYPSSGTYSGQVTVTDSSGNQTTVSCSNDPVTVIACTPSFTANPSTITQGQSSTLSWSESSSCASSCVGTGFSTGNALSGSMSVSPSSTSAYSLSCGAQAPVNQTVNVIVPSVTLTANPTRVAKGGHTALSWVSNNTNSCTVTGNGSTIGSGTSGSNVPDPNPVTEQTTYTAICSTNGNSVSATALVNIVPQFQEF